MIISIDESGTHRQSGCSIVALICIVNSETLAEIDRRVEELEKAIGTTEFHWAIKGWPFRRDFVNGLADLNFTVRLAQVNNPIKFDRTLREMLPYLMPERNIERIFIDGKKHRQYARMLKKSLRDKGVTVKKLKTVSDGSYPSIRIADAIAGAVRYYHDKHNAESIKLYKVIESKIEFIHIHK